MIYQENNVDLIEFTINAALQQNKIISKKTENDDKSEICIFEFLKKEGTNYIYNVYGYVSLYNKKYIIKPHTYSCENVIFAIKKNINYGSNIFIITTNEELLSEIDKINELSGNFEW